MGGSATNCSSPPFRLPSFGLSHVQFCIFCIGSVLYLCNYICLYLYCQSSPHSVCPALNFPTCNSITSAYLYFYICVGVFLYVFVFVCISFELVSHASSLSCRYMCPLNEPLKDICYLKTICNED